MTGRTLSVAESAIINLNTTKTNPMNKKHYLANAILWASAILTSAILHAPSFLTLVLLPVLAATALVTTRPKSSEGTCRP